MYKIKVTMCKEVGVAKKLVFEYPKAIDYGWLEHAPIFFIQTADGYAYFNQYEVQTIDVVEYKLEGV